MNKITSIILIVVGSVGLWVMNLTPYMKNEWKDVCVVKRYEDQTVHKGRAKKHHYLVMKDSLGRVFDRDVSISLFVTKDNGDCFKFKLREMDIAQNHSDNLLYFFLPIVIASLFLSVGITFLLLGDTLKKY